MKINKERAIELYNRGMEIELIDYDTPEVPTLWQKGRDNVELEEIVEGLTSWGGVKEYRVRGVVSKFNDGKGINNED